MSHLYVANPTKQHHEFTWRVGRADKTKVRQMTIRHGTQVRLPEDFTPEEIDHIVRHHQKYGAVLVDDLRSLRGHAVPLIFSVDRAVPTSRIEDAFRMNKAALAERGRKFRESGAIQINQQIQQQMDEQGLPGRIRDFDMEIVQEEPKGGYPDVEKPIGEGYHVEQADSAPPPKRSRKGRT